MKGNKETQIISIRKQAHVILSELAQEHDISHIDMVSYILNALYIMDKPSRQELIETGNTVSAFRALGIDVTKDMSLDEFERVLNEVLTQAETEAPDIQS